MRRRAGRLVISLAVGIGLRTSAVAAAGTARGLAEAHWALGRVPATRALPGLSRASARCRARCTASQTSAEERAEPCIRVPDFLLRDLDAQQRHAVTCPLDCAVRVDAGPGSGKTRVLTRRAAALLSQDKVPVRPRELLVLTFANKAARELRERLDSLLPPGESSEVAAYTFHSWCHAALAFALRLDTADHRRIAREQLRRAYGVSHGSALPEEAEAAVLGVQRQFAVLDADGSKRVARRVVEAARAEARAAMTAAAEALERGERPPRPVVGGGGGADLDLSATADEVVQAISRAKTGAEGAPVGPALRFVVREYERQLRLSNQLDFDDLLLWTLRALTHVEGCGELARARWPHLLVDEWQDTNAVQYALVLEMAAGLIPGHLAAHERPGAARSLFVVGDGDQSIYGFRGACARNHARLAHDLGGSSVCVRLFTNYRSTRAITAAACAVIGREGATHSAQAPQAKCPAVTVAAAGSTGAMHDLVARQIRLLCEPRHDAAGAGAGAAHSWADVAVLCRTNRMVQENEVALRAQGLPVVAVGAISFFGRAEVRDAVAHMALALGASDLFSLQRASRTPRRGIGEKALESFAAWLEEVVGRDPAPDAASGPPDPAAREQGAGGGQSGGRDRPEALVSLDEASASAERAPTVRDLLLALLPEDRTRRLAEVDQGVDLHVLASLRATCSLNARQQRAFRHLAEAVADVRAFAFAGASDPVHAPTAASAPRNTATDVRGAGCTGRPPSLGDVLAVLVERTGLRDHYAEVDAKEEREHSHTLAPATVLLGDDAPEPVDAGSLEETRVGRLMELVRMAGDQPTSVQAVLEFLAMAALGDLPLLGEDRTSVDAVTLTTMHRSKGLEFPCVIITHCEDGSIPIRRPGALQGSQNGHWDSDELPVEHVEEERRLMYVGVTRAMRRLYMVYRKRMEVTRRKDGRTIVFSREPSRFIVDVVKQVPEASGFVRVGSYPRPNSVSG